MSDETLTIEQLFARRFFSPATVTKSIDFGAGESGVTIWDPTAGKKFVITDIVVSTSAAGAITIFDKTDDLANRVCKLTFSATVVIAVIPYSKPREGAAADNILKYTTGAGIAGSLTVQGYEI